LLRSFAAIRGDCRLVLWLRIDSARLQESFCKNRKWTCDSSISRNGKKIETKIRYEIAGGAGNGMEGELQRQVRKTGWKPDLWMFFDNFVNVDIARRGRRGLARSGRRIRTCAVHGAIDMQFAVGGILENSGNPVRVGISPNSATGTPRLSEMSWHTCHHRLPKRSTPATH